MKLVGDACEGIVQVPPLREFFVPDVRNRAPAVLLQGAVSQGAQGRQSASMAESSAERGLLLRTGECGASAGVAGGASGVLEAAAQARKLSCKTAWIHNLLRTRIAPQDEELVLQDIMARQTPVMVGLIAHLTGSVLQDDIAQMTRRLHSGAGPYWARTSRGPPMEKHLIAINRVRRVPHQFSWVDHRLVRGNYLMKATAPAWALHFVLVTVGDEHGLSYYADRTLARLLSLGEESIGEAPPAHRCRCDRSTRHRCIRCSDWRWRRDRLRTLLPDQGRGGVRNEHDADCGRTRAALADCQDGKSQARKVRAQSRRAKTPLPKLDPYPRGDRTADRGASAERDAGLVQAQEQGYEGSYSIVKEYIRRIRPPRTEAFLTLKFAPGQCAQVDWGSFWRGRGGRHRARIEFLCAGARLQPVAARRVYTGSRSGVVFRVTVFQERFFVINAARE
ncbi:MAG: hypothetical protein HS122_05760 [Opitutaceae bacterium]|nr:hypothetical protein [Opitutaceae bacterium]